MLRNIPPPGEPRLSVSKVYRLWGLPAVDMPTLDKTSGADNVKNSMIARSEVHRGYVRLVQ